MQYGDRVRLNDTARAEHQGTKPLHREVGTVTEPNFIIPPRSIPIWLIEWDNGKASMVAEDLLDIIQEG